MSVRLDGQTIHLSGESRVEDAEPLVGLLMAAPTRCIDLSQAETLHTAVVQVLMAFRPELIGQPVDPFLRDQIIPILLYAS